jgi:DNA polymerase V
VDRSVKAVSGKVVIAILNGEMLIRRLEKSLNKLRLVPETPRLAPIDVDISGAEFSIWGVVTYVIHAL